MHVSHYCRKRFNHTPNMNTLFIPNYECPSHGPRGRRRQERDLFLLQPVYPTVTPAWHSETKMPLAAPPVRRWFPNLQARGSTSKLLVFCIKYKCNAVVERHHVLVFLHISNLCCFIPYTLLGTKLVFPALGRKMPECVIPHVPKGSNK